MAKILYNSDQAGGITTCIFEGANDFMIKALTHLGTKVLGNKQSAKKYAISFLARFDQLPYGMAILAEGDKWNEDLGKKIVLHKLLSQFTDMRIRYLEYVEDQEKKKFERTSGCIQLQRIKLRKIWRAGVTNHNIQMKFYDEVGGA